MGAVHHQTEPHSYGRGMPLGHRYAVAPVDGPQASSDQSPVGFCPLLDVSSPYLAGVRPGPFSHSSLRVTSRAKAAVLFPSRQMSSRRKFSGRRLSASYSARLFAGSLFVQRELARFDLAQHVTRQSLNAAERHQSRLSSVVSFDADQPSERIPQGAEQISQGHGNV